jgi:hypothetical protein
MKRYWLFGGESYYARGGMRDLIGSYDTEAEAKAAFDSAKANGAIDLRGTDIGWWQIFDSVEGKVVEWQWEAHAAVLCSKDSPIEWNPPLTQNRPTEDWE